MSAWDLPTTISINNIEYEIRTDFRAVLDVLTAMNDPDLFEPDSSEDEKNYVRNMLLLEIMLVDFENLSSTYYQEACEGLISFIDAGFEKEGKKKPSLMDWQQDAPIIIPAINRVQGTEIRAIPYMHWWTFLGSYMEIGECLFSQVIHIRQRKAMHKKLEKWEKDFYNANKDIIDLKKKISEEQQAEMAALEKWL